MAAVAVVAVVAVVAASLGHWWGRVGIADETHLVVPVASASTAGQDAAEEEECYEEQNSQGNPDTNANLLALR